jgi:hypothetical protein
MSPKDQLALIARSLGAVPEYCFHHSRKWRFDWAWPDEKVAIEYNGHHTTGRRSAKSKLLKFAAGAKETPETSGHSSITGITNDAEKGNHASALGWHVLRFTALHFDPTSRRKHNLEHPLTTIQRFIP